MHIQLPAKFILNLQQRMSGDFSAEQSLVTGINSMPAHC